MPRVVASLVVDFGGEDQADGSIMTLEKDSRARNEGGLNLGRTQFYPGDSVYLLLFASDNVTNIVTDSDVGSLATESSVPFEVDRLITVSNTAEVSLPYPVSSNFSADWLGRSFDSDGSTAVISRTLFEDRKIILSEPAFGQLHVTYQAQAQVLRLHNTAVGDEKVYVFAVGDVP